MTYEVMKVLDEALRIEHEAWLDTRNLAQENLERIAIRRGELLASMNEAMAAELAAKRGE